jgi:hypothetical protein
MSCPGVPFLNITVIFTLFMFCSPLHLWRGPGGEVYP